MIDLLFRATALAPRTSAALADNAAALPTADGNVTAMTDIHDIKQVLDMGLDWRWLYWAAAVLALLALVLLARRLRRRRRQDKNAAPAAAPAAPETEAFAHLDALAADPAVDAKLFYFRLSAIVRRYIERRYAFPAQEMTTEELLPRLDRLTLPTDLIQPLRAFCRHADPIKFAGAAALREKMADDLAFARLFVIKSTEAPKPDDNPNADHQNTLEENRTKEKAPLKRIEDHHENI